MSETDPDAAIVREAIAAIRRGHRDAYATVVDLYQRRLFGLALMMTRDPAGAEDVVQDAPSTGPDPLAGLITDERDRRLWDAVSALSSGERTAVILLYRQDMGVNDIASAMGVSAGTGACRSLVDHRDGDGAHRARGWGTTRWGRVAGSHEPET